VAATNTSEDPRFEVDSVSTARGTKDIQRPWLSASSLEECQSKRVFRQYQRQRTVQTATSELDGAAVASRLAIAKNLL